MIDRTTVAALALPQLEATEVEHYRWLLTGLLDGAWRLAARELPETSTVPEAIDATRELVDELFARIPVSMEAAA